VPGAPRLVDQGEDAPVLLDEVVSRDLGGRIGEPRQRRRAALHAGVVQDDHVRRGEARAEIGREGRR